MKSYRTDIAWSSPDSITVFGRSLPDEILGHLSFGDMAFLELTARIPTLSPLGRPVATAATALPIEP